MRPALRKTEDLLDTLQKHFSSIQDTLRGQSIWDNSTRISTDLFQTYFSMAVTVANQTMYLEAQMEKIKEIQRERDIASGRNPTQ
jgi:hypothetical protein